MITRKEQQLKNNLKEILIGLRAAMEKVQAANRKIHMDSWVLCETDVDESTHVEDCGTPCCVIGYAALDDEFEEVIEQLESENTEFDTWYNIINKSDLTDRAAQLDADIRKLVTPKEEVWKSKAWRYFDLYSSLMGSKHQGRESDFKQALQKMGLGFDNFKPHRHLATGDVTPADVIEHIDICLSLIKGER